MRSTRELDFVSSPSHPHVRLSPIHVGLDSIMLDSEERGIPKSYTRIHHVGAIMSEQAVRTCAALQYMIHHGVYRAEKNRFLRHWGNDVNVNVNVPP